jgi:hypothetical protein
MSELPDSIGAGETPEQRYERCARWYNVTVGRYNAAVDALTSAEAEFRDAEMWLNEARDEMNRSASVIGLPRWEA